MATEFVEVGHFSSQKLRSPPCWASLLSQWPRGSCAWLEREILHLLGVNSLAGPIPWKLGAFSLGERDRNTLGWAHHLSERSSCLPLTRFISFMDWYHCVEGAINQKLNVRRSSIIFGSNSCWLGSIWMWERCIISVEWFASRGGRVSYFWTVIFPLIPSCCISLSTDSPYSFTVAHSQIQTA